MPPNNEGCPSSPPFVTETPTGWEEVRLVAVDTGKKVQTQVNGQWVEQPLRTQQIVPVDSIT